MHVSSFQNLYCHLSPQVQGYTMENMIAGQSALTSAPCRKKGYGFGVLGFGGRRSFCSATFGFIVAYNEALT